METAPIAQGPVDVTVSRKTIFVCCACGKRSHDRYGYKPIDLGWDESCALNSVESYEDSLVISGGRVVEIRDGGIVPANAELCGGPSGPSERAPG